MNIVQEQYGIDYLYDVTQKTYGDYWFIERMYYDEDGSVSHRETVMSGFITEDDARDALRYILKLELR